MWENSSGYQRYHLCWSWTNSTSSSSDPGLSEEQGRERSSGSGWWHPRLNPSSSASSLMNSAVPGQVLCKAKDTNSQFHISRLHPTLIPPSTECHSHPHTSDGHFGSPHDDTLSHTGISLEWERMKETMLKKKKKRIPGLPQEAESAQSCAPHAPSALFPPATPQWPSPFPTPSRGNPAPYTGAAPVLRANREHQRFGCRWTLPRDQATCSPSFVWVRTRTRTLLYLNLVHLVLVRFSHPFQDASTALVNFNLRQTFSVYNLCCEQLRLSRPSWKPWSRSLGFRFQIEDGVVWGRSWSYPRPHKELQIELRWWVICGDYWGHCGRAR